MKMVHPADIKANGHYSPGVYARGLLFISGQLPIDAVTGKLVEGDAALQARQSLQNLDKVLMGAGLARDRVVSVHIYVSDIKCWDKVDKVYAEFFGNHKPARVVVPTGKMHYGALVEIEAVAEERGLIAD
ncbi:RidA family protein [Selenomonas sp. KH1T6]|uniref:RidA family protein n=1 Tax=Selenomonas sp. KH1T6 TaxID=3158784 RepID=UPI0008A80EB8|nr:reactive intermediate/imine deaminase [Selenomonas ruminantium]